MIIFARCGPWSLQQDGRVPYSHLVDHLVDLAGKGVPWSPIGTIILRCAEEVLRHRHLPCTMPDLISEPITPMPGSFDTSAMGRGEPGLPQRFTWRGEPFDIVETLECWKHSSREGGVGQLYLRRHYYKLRMSGGSVWTIYFVRHTPKSGNAKLRWFLYTIDREEDDT